jgi:dTMP kinase
MSGYFITFEGGEGSGKSTQIQLLVDHLSRALSGVAPVVTREPGGTDSAESIRQLLVTGKAERWRAATEAMLMSASRHEHVAHVLRPALAAGKLVICDRYNDSTQAYQGLVGGVPREDIEALNRLACGDLVPDLTILLDMDVAEGLRRASDRAGDESRFESKGLEFHQKVRTAFLDLAGRYPDRFVIVDAGRSVETVAADIVDIVMPRLATARLG